MVYNSEEVKDPSFIILEDDILKKMVFKKSDGSTLVIPLADITDVEALKSALSGTFAHTQTPGVAMTAAAIQGLDNGGQILRHPRQPGIAVLDQFPKPGITHDIVWVSTDGTTLYGIGTDKGVYKSVDSGATWTLRANTVSTYAVNGTFLKLVDGTLLTTLAGSPQKFVRSADDGATWATVFTMRTGTQLMGPQSWCQDAVTGYVYAVEYDGVTANTQTEVDIVRSTDNGATWSVFHAFKGQADGGTGYIRHLHSCQYDPVSQRVYFLAGDTEAYGGIYRVDAAGTDVEKVVLNSETPSGEDARTIGMMWFADYLAWGTDSPESAKSYLCRLPRTKIGVATPADVEKVYKLNSSGWFTQQAASDRSKYLLCASNETGTGRLDEATHIYQVSDQGASIFEVATVPSGTAISSMAPVGQAEQGGDRFWLRAHNFEKTFAVKAILTRGSTHELPKPFPRPRVRAWITAQSGLVTLAPGAEQQFWVARAGVNSDTLYIFDIGLVKVPGPGALRVEVTTSAGVLIQGLQLNDVSRRATSHRDGDEYLYAIPVASNADTYFRLREINGTDGATGFAFVVYGFGR